MTKSAWLLSAAADTVFLMPILPAITTGVRSGEILALRWQDIDFEHGAEQQALKARMGAAYRDQGLVCAMPDGRPIVPKYISDRFRYVVAKAGLPHMTFRALRHSHATMLTASGVPVKVVSGMLGHSNTAITQDIYTHLLPTMQKQAAETIDTILQRSPEEL